MKKLLYSVILIAFLVAMGIVYYSWEDDYHMSNRGWKVEKPELVTWEMLDRQYVVYKDVIYTYELYFPKDMEDRMQNLMGLIHNWNPE